MKGRSLGEARKLFRARKFPDVIRALEPQVFRFRESFEYFILLGLSCLHTGDFGGATSYLGRARQLEKDNIDACLGLAAVHFKQGQTEQALKLWLDVLDEDSRNAVARRGMNLLRKGLKPDEIMEIAESGKLKNLFPPLPRRVRILPIAAVAAAVLLIGPLGYLGVRALVLPRVPVRPGVVDVELPPDLLRLTDGAQGAVYSLTERQVREAFNRSRQQLLTYHDNLAVVEINRILLSNASLPVKERARLLKTFVARQSFTAFKDGFPYRDVRKDPGLYDGACVRWKGKVANLVSEKDAIRFDFLVGYDQEKELEGIVGVRLPFAAQLENGTALEVLGQVASADGTLRLDGISLHRLLPPS